MTLLKLKRQMMKSIGPLLLIALSVLASVLFHRNYLTAGWDGSDEPIYNRQLGAETKHPIPIIVAGRLNPVNQGGWFYRPTFTTRYALTLKAFGENPAIFHLQNLILHGLAIGFLMILVNRILPAGGQFRSVITLLSGIGVFAFNLKSEAMWWISASSTQEAALWSVITLLLWICRSEQTDRKRAALLYMGSVLTFWLALGAKQEALFLPFALVVLDNYIAARAQVKWKIVRTEVLPFVALTIIAFACNVIAYRLSGAHDATATSAATTVSGHLSYFNLNGLLSRLNTVLVFINTLLFGIFGTWWLLAVAGIVSVWFIVRNRTVRLLWLLTLVAAVIPPLQASNHAVNNARLYYLPSMFAVPFVISALSYLLLSNDRKNRVLATVALILVFPNPLERYTNEPFIVLAILSIVLYVAWRLYQENDLSKEITLLIVLVAIGTQLHLYLPLPWLWGWQILTMLAVAWWLRWNNILLVGLCWGNPAVSLPLALLFGRQRKAATVPRPAEIQRGEPAVPLEGTATAKPSL